MSHKHSKREKHSEKDKSKKYLDIDYKEMSKEDMDELELLKLQLAGVQIYFCSDIFFYAATIRSFQFLDYSEEDNNENDRVSGIESINQYLIASAFYGLMARTLFGIVDFTRYRELEERKKKGEIKYSLTPNIFINLFDMLNIVAYSYILLGYIKLDEADIDNFIQVFNVSCTKILLNVQEQAILLRIYGTCSLYESTLRSIELIYDKYNNDTNNNVIPPYESALQASRCYLTARILIENINFSLFDKVSMDEDSAEVVEAYGTLWTGNVYGVIANFQGLAGILGIKERNINQPIFGV